jgi:transcriptional regulator with XRE-family HTH domain
MPDVKRPPLPAVYRRIGELIRAFRRKAELSQEALGLQVGRTRTSITNIEAGRQRFTLDFLFLIADALHTDARELIPSADSVILPAEIEKKLPKHYTDTQRRALQRVVSR